MSPLIIPPSGENLSGDDWSQYSGEAIAEMDCLQKLREYCKLFHIPASDSLIFRFACFYSFGYEETRKGLKKDYDNPYLSFQMDDVMMKQFQTAILYPLPRMRTKKRKSQVIYARPARYIRSPEAFDELLKQLCYILNDLSRTAQQCQHGVSLLINLKGFSRRNVDLENSTRLLQLIQSHLVPTKLEMIIFVDTTATSSNIWQSLSPLLSPEETNKIHFTRQDDLHRYLMPSFEKYLPEEIASGWRNTYDIIGDYVERKVKMEKEQQEQLHFCNLEEEEDRR